MSNGRKRTKKKEEPRLGTIRFIKGLRYKLRRRSHRWERDYRLPNNKPPVMEDHAPPIVRPKEQQDLVSVAEDRSGFIHKNPKSDFFKETPGNPEAVKGLKRVSAVKTYHGKTKSELREDYMFKRAALTRRERSLWVVGSIYGAAVSIGRKGRRGTGFGGFRNNLVKVLELDRIRKSKPWKTVHQGISNMTARVAKPLQSLHLNQIKRAQKITRTKTMAQALAKKVPIGNKMGFQFRGAKRFTYHFNNSALSGLKFIQKRPTYGVALGILSGITYYRIRKTLMERRYYTERALRDYEYQRRER